MWGHWGWVTPGTNWIGLSGGRKNFSKALKHLYLLILKCYFLELGLRKQYKICIKTSLLPLFIIVIKVKMTELPLSSDIAI